MKTTYLAVATTPGPARTFLASLSFIVYCSRRLLHPFGLIYRNFKGEAIGP